MGEQQCWWKQGAEGRTQVSAKAFWQDRAAKDFLLM